MSLPALTFFPGPSQLFPQIGQWLQEAANGGILSASHRGAAFVAMSKETVELVHEKLGVPADYQVLFTTSATESWEIIPQSLTAASGYHLYTGAFGEKWYQYASKLRPASYGLKLDVNAVPDPALTGIGDEHELICLTQNETSNGTQLQPAFLQAIRQNFPDKLIAVDVTSSINGISLPFQLADVWYGSVQKCFGMPAGLGLLIVSPAAVQRAVELAERNHYNSLLVLLDNAAKYQTTCTPNVLGIYLLNRVLTSLPSVAERETALRARAKELYALLDNHSSLSALVTTTINRSDTVVTVSCQEPLLSELKKHALDQGFALGNGYGAWKQNTFRLANFPAITDQQWELAKAFVKSVS